LSVKGIHIAQQLHMRKLLIKVQLILIICFISVATYGQEKQSDNCVNLFNSLEASISDLAINGYISHQYHPQLRRMGYVVRNGGLCVPCSINVVFAALDHMNGKMPIARPEDIAKLTDSITQFQKVDARYGLMDSDQVMQKFAGFIKENAGKRGHQIKVYNRNSFNPKGQPQIPFSESVEAIYLLSTSVHAEQERYTRYVWNHFSVGFNFDKRSMTIKIIDPVHTKIVRTAKLIKSKLPDGSGVAYKLQFDQGLPIYPQRPLVFLDSALVIRPQ